MSKARKGKIPWNKGKTAKEDNRIKSGKERYNWKGGHSNTEWQRIYYKQKYNLDAEYTIKLRIKSLVKQAFRYYTKTGKTLKSKKYGINYKKIIEKLKPFPINWKELDIDHIYPLSKFKFINFDGSTNLEEIRKAHLPNNFQWLTREENMKKFNHITKQSNLIK